MRRLGVNPDEISLQVAEALGAEVPQTRVPQTREDAKRAHELSGTLIRRYLKSEPIEAVPENLKALDAEWAELTRQKESAVNDDEYESASEFREKANETETEFVRLLRECREKT